MGIKQIETRDENIINILLDIWKSSVIETHTFLSIEDIIAIRPDVIEGLKYVDMLYCYHDNKNIPHGFIGINEQKIEMLFVDSAFRGNGIGTQLLKYAIINLGVKYVDVNEQNEQGIGFYSHMGFQIVSRYDLDDQGRPFPILHLKLSEKFDNI